jgi:hypothetical protein
MSKMANNTNQKNKKTPSAASTRQMDVWRTLMSQLTRALPTPGVVQLASNLTSPNHTHNSVNAFMAAFEAAKSGTEHTLITSSLVYKFRGDENATHAEWIGVPMQDRIFYIGRNGRTACTGNL